MDGALEPRDRALNRRQAFTLLGPLLALLASGFVLPLLGLLGASLEAPGWSLRHYARFLGDPYYLGVLWRSLLLGLSVVAVTLLLGLPLAYWLARLQSRFVPGLLLLATFPLWISAVVRSFGWVVLLGRSGLLTRVLHDSGLAEPSFQLLYTMGGVVLALAQVLLPFMLLSLYGVLRNISPELERAAQNLGCGPWRAAGLVTLPLARRGIFSASLLVFALAVSAFATPSLVGGARVQLVSTTIYEQMTELADWKFASAVAFILLTVVLAITAVYTRLGGDAGGGAAMMRVLGLVSLLALAYLLLPVAVVVGSALGETAYLAFPPRGLTLHWFGAALADPRYARAFLTSLSIAGATAVLALLIGLPAAYALARLEFPGRRSIETAIMMPLVLPALVLAIGLTILCSRIGFTAGGPRLVLGHLVLCAPYVVRVTLPVLQRLDPALEEAAQNLGASPLAGFLLVTLPGIRPGAIAAATLAFIVSFDEIDLAIFLSDPRAPTLPVTIYSAVQLGIDPVVAAVSALLVLLAASGMGLYQVVLWRQARA